MNKQNAQNTPNTKKQEHQLIERVIRLFDLLQANQIELDQFMNGIGWSALLNQKTEEELQIDYDLLKFMEAMPGGFLIYYADGNEEIIYANQGLLRIFQCGSIEEFRAFTGNSFRGLIYPEDLDTVEKSIRTQITGSQYDLDYVEYRILRKDGAIRWIEDYGHFIHSDAAGDIFYVFLWDATEKKKRILMEKTLLINEKQEQEREFKNLIDGYEQERKFISQEYLRRLKVIQGLSVNYESICYVELDRDQIMPYRFSTRTSVLFGERFRMRKFSKYVSDYIRTWVHPEDRELVTRAMTITDIREKLAKSQTYYLNYRVLVNGELQYLQLRIVDVGERDSGNAENAGNQNQANQLIFGYRRVDEEIQRELEQKQLLAEALEKANLAVTAKNTFLSNISHDMRTPLNAIFGFISLAKLNLSDPETASDYLERAETASRKLLDMISQVLEMSSLSSAAGPDEVECDFCEILQEIFEFLLPQAQEKEIAFTLDCQNIRHSGIYADEEKLKQLVLSLANNALTYTPDGGKVHISLTEDTLPNHYSVYHLVVEDTGIGISEEFLEKVFEPFSREKNTTLSGIHGIGLGLTITKNIVDLMGGTIDVKSVVNQGSKFTVALRLQVQPQSSISGMEAIQRNELSDRSQPSQRLLLVEDNEINREIETELLENMGFQIDSAENGKIALEKVQSAEPGDYDVIIMDLQMPVMDGWEASAAIRKIPNQALAQIPIVALSANVLESDQKKSKESGIDVHLTKPLNLSVLLDTIEEITGKRRAS